MVLLHLFSWPRVFSTKICGIKKRLESRNLLISGEESLLQFSSSTFQARFAVLK